MTKSPGKKRNASLELFRCLLMFGIVLGHSAYQCGHVLKIGSLTDWTVCGFVFLSGWFGIKFSWSKIAKLIALGVWCALVGNMIGGETNPLVAMLGAKSYAYWFLWAYIILMMFAPIINAAFENVHGGGGEGGNSSRCSNCCLGMGLGVFSGNAGFAQIYAASDRVGRVYIPLTNCHLHVCESL